MVAFKNDLLEHPLDRLEAALAADPAGGPAVWMRNYRDVLGDLTRAMREHISATESPGGALTTLESPRQQTVATLEHLVQGLRSEHSQLVTSVGELHSNALSLSDRCPDGDAVATPVAEIMTVRQAGEELLTRLRDHQHTERKLLMDTINTDVGVGDLICRMHAGPS